jgi:hypothetical protein
VLLRRGRRRFDRFGRLVIGALWRSGGEMEAAADCGNPSESASTD